MQQWKVLHILQDLLILPTFDCSSSIVTKQSCETKNWCELLLTAFGAIIPNKVHTPVSSRLPFFFFI